MTLWPKKKQWNDWSLPSKLTAIGTLLGFLSLGVYLVEKTYKLVVSGLIFADWIMTKGIKNTFQMLIAVNVTTVARIGVESGRITYHSP